MDYEVAPAESYRVLLGTDFMLDSLAAMDYGRGILTVSGDHGVESLPLIIIVRTKTKQQRQLHCACSMRSACALSTATLSRSIVRKAACCGSGQPVKLVSSSSVSWLMKNLALLSKSYDTSAQPAENEAEAAAHALLAAPPAAAAFEAPLAETVDKSDWQILPRLFTKFNYFTLVDCFPPSRFTEVFTASPLTAREPQREMDHVRWPP